MSFAIESAPSEVRTLPRGSAVVGSAAHLALIDDAGEVVDVLGGACSDSSGDTVRVAPLSRYTSMFFFVSDRYQLEDGDVFLIGSQRIRFRALRMPALPSTLRSARGAVHSDVAVLEQLRSDDTVRDTLHLTTGRRVLIGRDAGDWVFPYDPTVSARHAELVPEGTGESRASWTLRDLGSRNGTGVAVRAPRRVRAGERLLVGGQMMRVEHA
ncbi:MAG: FHA domain-containing protein [Gemmatimonadaceae bacterium]